MTPPPAQLGIRAAATALLLVAGLGNEWVLAAAVSQDGTLHDATRSAVRAAQAVLAATAVAAFVWQRRLAAVAADPVLSLRLLLVAGIALRVVVFVYLGPENNDPHLRYVHYIVEHGHPPPSDAFVLAFQPPLYYALAAPLAAIGSDKTVQLLSLLFAVANLVVLYRLIKSSPLLATHGARWHAMALASLTPQFVLFGNFVSNDALAQLLGTVVFAATFRLVEQPTTRRAAQLGTAVGIGLLTKGTFTCCIPAVLALLLALALRHPHATLSERLRRFAGLATVFLAVAVILGSYKFIENTVNFGTPVVDNSVLAQEWVDTQTGTYQGFSSLVDVDVSTLVRHPLGEQSHQSIPLLYYGTFWFSHIQESNFNATRQPGLLLIPRALYLLGILPTLLMIGAALGMLWNWRRPFAILRADIDRFRVHAHQLVVLLFLLGNLAVVTTWGLRMDAWSFFQARLLFAMFFSIAVLLGAGYQITTARSRALRWLCGSWLGITYAAFFAYYAAELAQQIARR